jgi:hypothetical protein
MFEYNAHDFAARERIRRYEHEAEAERIARAARGARRRRTAIRAAIYGTARRYAARHA